MPSSLRVGPTPMMLASRGAYLRRHGGYHGGGFCLLLILVILATLASAQDVKDPEEEEIEASRAVLFPWFAEALGVIIFYLTTRYVLVLPYTAIMFILGTAMGAGATRLGLEDHLTQSLMMWDDIDYEVLLLIFLPGLVFNDAFGLNVHLFGLAIWQCLVYAFPMVLAGTCLTALVGYYIFPFSWSFNLAMTFGSILSATDPVAVSALLEEVGAPPRLKIHIGGESLLNDGSAMVFYTIFSSLFLSELGIAGVGESVDVAEGFALFFRMSLGGAAVGFAFALALIVVLYMLNRRLTSAESVVQVCSTVTFAYLCYYTADSVCGTSGVIATLTCGVLTQTFGSSMINDVEMMNAFWGLVEQLLNTLLFTLGGLVFGGVVANYGEREGYWTANEWGYLILLWVLLQAIRYLCVYSFYPIIKSIGLGTNWKEAFFLSYGGLRGAVGISLAIALDNNVWSVTEDETYRQFTTQLFGMIGGTAFLTLVINGSTAGPLLQKLGLAKSTETRQKVLQLFKKDYTQKTYDNFICLLTDKRFARFKFAHVRHHVPSLKDLTEEDLNAAVRRYKEKVADSSSYKEPNLDSVLSYLRGTEEGATKDGDAEKQEEGTTQSSDGSDIPNLKADDSAALTDAFASEQGDSAKADPNILKELRTTFIEQLKWAYQKQLVNGDLDGRQAFLLYAISQGLEFAADDVSNGKPLKDMEASQLISSKSIDRVEGWAKKAYTINGLVCKKRLGDERVASGEFRTIRFTVLLSMATIEAHNRADERFKAEFSGKYPTEANQVIHESNDQTSLAKAKLAEYDAEDVEVVTEHLLCIMMLNKSSRYIEGLLTSGLLSEKEAEEASGAIQKELDAIHQCSEFK